MRVSTFNIAILPNKSKGRDKKMKDETNRPNLAILWAIERKDDPDSVITPLGLDVLKNLGLIEIENNAEINRQNELLLELPALEEKRKELKGKIQESKNDIGQQVSILPITKTLCLVEKKIALLKKIRDGLHQYIEIDADKFVRLSEEGSEFISRAMMTT